MSVVCSQYRMFTFMHICSIQILGKSCIEDKVCCALEKKSIKEMEAYWSHDKKTHGPAKSFEAYCNKQAISLPPWNVGDP